MPDLAQTLVDTTVGISASLPSTFDSVASTGYPSLTFTLIGQVTDWTPGGKAYVITNSNPIAQRSTDKFKATYNNGQDTMTLNRDDDDAGQIILLSALESDADQAFEITYQDSTIDNFTGKVMSYITTAGGADAMVGQTLVIERTRDTVVS